MASHIRRLTDTNYFRCLGLMVLLGFLYDCAFLFVTDCYTFEIPTQSVGAPLIYQDLISILRTP